MKIEDYKKSCVNKLRYEELKGELDFTVFWIVYTQEKIEKLESKVCNKIFEGKSEKKINKLIKKVDVNKLEVERLEKRKAEIGEEFKCMGIDINDIWFEMRDWVGVNRYMAF